LKSAINRLIYQCKFEAPRAGDSENHAGKSEKMRAMQADF